jgi:hypothetical protein
MQAGTAGVLLQNLTPGRSSISKAPAPEDPEEGLSLDDGSESNRNAYSLGPLLSQPEPTSSAIWKVMQIPRKKHCSILDRLREISSLPLARDLAAPLPTDLVLDVTVSSFQLGGLLLMEFGTIDLTLFWRPRVTVTARLYISGYARGQGDPLRDRENAVAALPRSGPRSELSSAQQYI